MTTYKESATKDDKKFHRVARKVLGNDYYAACEEANEAFTKAYQPAIGAKKENAGRRAANQVILKWLRECGITNWKDENQRPVKREVVKSNFASEKVKARKFNSACGLWEKKL